MAWKQLYVLFHRPMHAFAIKFLSSGVLRTLFLLTAIQALRAQSVPSLGLEFHPGVSITGTVGRVYAIQYTSDAAQTNSWKSLTFLQLPATNHLWMDTTRPANAKRFYRALLQNAPTNMVFIPPNSFKQGNPTNEINAQRDEAPQNVVTISQGFWIGQFEVTQKEYLDLLGTNPSSITGDLSRPVESVSWEDATNYCARLTERELAAGRIPLGSLYRLPTEAEWEYSARAWTSTQFTYGDDPQATRLTNYAWYGDNSGFQSHPVGEKQPNPWGLYDMTGNVWEWCQDWYGTYPGGFQTDPQGPAASTGTGLGSYKVMRGGGFDYGAQDCRSARRLIFAPNLTDYDLGFRVVLAAGGL